MENKQIKAIVASRGVAIAKAFKVGQIKIEIEQEVVSNEDHEIERVENAISATVQQLDTIKEQVKEKLSDAESEVFEAHKMMVQDPALKDRIIDNIKSGKMSASKGVDEATNYFMKMFEAMEDEYFKARALDIKDVKTRFLANLLGIEIPDLTTIDEQVIIIADDLTPSETSQLNKKYTLGFVTNVGGETSHSAIMARSMEIPALVGAKTAMREINSGELIIVDAINGSVIINPTEEVIEKYQKQILELNEEKADLKNFIDLKSVTKDNYQVELAANIGSVNDLEGVLENGAEAIGLYRTEFLYMNSNALPNEKEQFEAYRKVLETMNDKAVVIRTLDIGGDKNVEYLNIPQEMNPFLGYRAIRLCLDRDDIFRVQLRALLRASTYGNLKVMFPMIATIDELREAKKILFEEREKLVSEGIEVSKEIEIGMMIEIPATAMMADVFAREVDFFSIGTNDLIQYTMACDRMSEKVSYLYQPYNPAILRMVKNVIDAANNNGIWVGMCGEMASDEVALPLLIGLGLHEFSMSASSVLRTRKMLSVYSKEEIDKHMESVLNLDTADKVKEYVQTIIMDKRDE